MENTSTELVVRNEANCRLVWENEAAIIWHHIRGNGCHHQDRGAGFCLGATIYVARDCTNACAKHAADYIEEDANDILEGLRRLKDAVEALTRRGQQVPALVAQLAALDIPEEEPTYDAE